MHVPIELWLLCTKNQINSLIECGREELNVCYRGEISVKSHLCQSLCGKEYSLTERRLVTCTVV